MPYRIAIVFFILIFVIDSSQSAFSQKRYKHELGFQNDNDVYLMITQDQYYTNGIGLYYKKATDSTRFSEKLQNKTWAISAGQKLYNASTGSVEAASQVDRPLTGYLYASGELNWYLKNETTFSIEAEVAVIGERAYGRNMQESFHKVLGFYEVKGWEYQLNNSIGADVRARFNRLLHRSQSAKFDITLATEGSLGSNHTFVSLSPYFRWGRINPLYESIAMGSRIQSKSRKPARELFLFYQPKINYVFYDSTIQGGMRNVDKGPIVFGIKPFVVSQLFGAQWASGSWGVSFYYTFNSKEVKSAATPHQFGTFSVLRYF